MTGYYHSTESFLPFSGLMNNWVMTTNNNFTPFHTTWSNWVDDSENFIDEPKETYKKTQDWGDFRLEF